MPSSLQVASARGRIQTKKIGEFEACFADGLDLSEFGSTGGRTSHSSALLNLKKVEADRKLKEEREEERMKELVEQKRAQQLLTKEPSEERSTRKRGETSVLLAVPPTAHRDSSDRSSELRVVVPGSSEGLMSAVVADMHSEDQKDPRHRMKKRRGKRQRPVTKGGKAAKKAQRRKH